MATKNEYLYSPDLFSSPGETLMETLKAKGMSQYEFAIRSNMSPKNVNEIIKGKAPIKEKTAIHFERVLGIPARFWLNLESQYRESLEKVKEKKLLSSYVELLRKFPIADMVRRGWLKKCETNVDQLLELLSFFRVSSPEQLNNKTLLFNAVSFRNSKFQSDPYALKVWLQKGENDATEIECNPYNERSFLDQLNHIRKLTTSHFGPAKQDLIKKCASAGVAVVVVPEIGKARVSGATRWLNPNKALIQLSQRYKTDDHFWFTFFHEAGHILLHGKKDIFLEVDGVKTNKETEADKFASNFLIPESEYTEFIRRHPHPTIKDIKMFSKKIGTSVSIIVGRLQHDKIIPYSKFNSYKKKITSDVF